MSTASGHAHGTHVPHESPKKTASLRFAAIATLHCLTGCAIGEILGLVIGTALSLGNALTIVLAITLAFFFGYSLTLLPLRRAGLTLASAGGWRKTCKAENPAEPGTVPYRSLIRQAKRRACPSSSSTSCSSASATSCGATARTCLRGRTPARGAPTAGAGDLERFRDMIEARGVASGGWRGEVENAG